MNLIKILIVCLLLASIGCTEEKTQKKEAATPQKPQVTPGEMVLIPAGEFTMGSNDIPQNVEEKDKYRCYPEQKVNLPAFYIDKYEVTNAEFLKFTQETGYMSEAEAENKSWKLFFGFDPAKENFPVVNVTWDDANAYAKWAGKRLPTEAEWEKAARGTDGRRYPWGNDWAVGKSNTYEAGGQPKEVGSFESDKSPFGVYDTLGNAQEWTASWYKAYPRNKKRNPDFGEKYRVVRGASSSMRGKLYHIWDRTAYPPKALFGVGFRCAKDAEKASTRGDKRRRLARVGFEPSEFPLGWITNAFRSSFPGQITLSMKHFR